MPPPFRKISLDQFAALLREFPFTRSIDAVHMHHTWRPTRAQFKGHETIVGMWRHHTSHNGWRDIAQHLSIDPQGGLWLGRSWNLAPVSATGHNGSAANGPFMFEMIADFDTGQEPFDGPQKEAALAVCALVLDRFGLPTSSLRFHRQMAKKSCPGTGISYEQTLLDVDALRSGVSGGEEGFGFESVAGAGPDAGPETGEPEILFGDEGEPPAEDVAEEGEEILFGEEDDAAPAEPQEADGATGVQDLIVSLLREDVSTGAEAAWAEPGEKEGGPEIRGAVSVGGQEGLFGGPQITTEIKEALRPHVINLTRGRLSSGGLFSTTEADVARIFDEDLEQAVAGRGPANPLHLVIWAHGGLTDEAGGLLGAYQKTLWWNRNGVYPLFFVWETGLPDALWRVIRQHFGAEEAATEGLRDRFTEFTDRRVEALARTLGGVEVWGDMKESAKIAAGPDGGSTVVARKLAAFCARHPGAVQLHAVGHSAGSIFHAWFLNAARKAGVPVFENLFLLAPAIRTDAFHQLLAPLLGSYVRRTPVFTMTRLRELDDTCVRVYQKSLLYLIYYALEKKREEPILGLEISLRADPKLRSLFGLAGAAAGSTPVGEVIWSRSPATAGLRHRSGSITHGGFDDDVLTLDSLLRRVLGRDQIPFSFSGAAALTPEAAVPGGEISSGGAPAFVAGEEGVAVEEEVYDVSFDVLDAFERAAELSMDGTGGVPLTEGLAAPGGIEIAFGANARPETVSAFSREVLTGILRRAGLSRVIITSTSRDASDQARVMFQNLEKFGVAHQKRLYGPSGDQVIEVYRQAKAGGKPADTIRQLMTQEILRIGPTRVSRHAADPRVLNVFDVAPSSVANRAAFEQAVKAEPRVAKFLVPPTDPGYHLEIPQPQA